MEYSRLLGAIDTDLLKNTHIIGVGAGGAYSLYEGLVRSGLGKLTIVDFDTVDDVNLCRQGFYPEDIGEFKVNALGKHLLRINPSLKYTAMPSNILYWDDPGKILYDADLLLFLTDSFEAQAFGNKIALKYKKPAIWAGFYEKSQCAEIIFYIPKVTSACFRCCVPSRYVAQEQKKIHVSSNCNTIFHSQLLDSIIGMLVMAILHNNTTEYEFSEWFGSTFKRNLIQMNTNPNYESKLFDDIVISTRGKTLLFNSIWQQINHNPDCPDCTT
jgi:molybdopterin/thiamine biosynthesis adenylyltransferase